jgi:AAA-like domain/TIR domain
LRTAATLGQDSWRRFADCTKAVVFLATPHAGARLANYVGLLGRVLRTTAAVEDLNANDPHLRELTQWYRNNAHQLKIDTRVFFEAQDTAGVRVVDETSADPGIAGVVPVPVDADHFSICKPANRDALVYKSIRQYLSQYAQPKPSHTTQSSTEANIASFRAISDRTPRFFISYRRRAQDDSRLAMVLVDRLGRAGCEVFIDQGMPMGIDWSAEIDRRIAWCDYLVVLISEDSVSSEMVQAEVRRAHQASKSEGRSKILPIRVAYTGPLGYELDSYIGKLQYALWQSVADDGNIVAKVLGASAGQAPLPEASVPPLDQGTKPADRPEPKADMRLIRESVDAPGSPLGSDNPFYVPRDADRRIAEFASGKARTVVIKGPHQTGKSSLLLRYLAQCHAAGKKVAFIDLMTFGSVRSLSFSDFALQFAEVLMEELDIRGVAAPTFKRALELTNFLHDQILPRVDAPMVIAVDEADRAIGSAWQEDFYSALRGWDGNRTHPGKKERWGRLGLALVIATDPKMLIESGYTSPFNVTPPVTLAGFAREALDAFNASYKQMLSTAELDRLYVLLNGHPYLTPLAFYRLIWEETTFSALCENAAKDSGPFGDHLRAKLDGVNNAHLREAMREVVFNSAVPGNDRRLFYRLEAAGLAREDTGRIVASNDLYKLFFRAYL